MYLPVRPLVDVKVFRVLQHAINTSKAAPKVSLIPLTLLRLRVCSLMIWNDHSISCLDTAAGLVLGHSSRAGGGKPPRTPPSSTPLRAGSQILSRAWTQQTCRRGTPPPDTPLRARPLVLGHIFIYQTSTFQNLEMDKHHEVAVFLFPNFGKLESLENMLLLLQPLWVTVLSLVQTKGNKDDRSAQAVQDESSLSPAATRAGFSMAPRPQVGNVHNSHSVAATIRPSEVRNHTRVTLLR